MHYGFDLPISQHLGELLPIGQIALDQSMDVHGTGMAPG
jgi:hypothetical protein